MSNDNRAAKYLLVGMLVVLLGAMCSHQLAAAARAPHQAPHTGARYGAKGALARATLTPEPTAGPPRPELCERPPTGSALPAGCVEQPADICLRLSVDPGGAIPPASIATYQLVAHNNGRGDAADLRITLPFAPDIQAPLDATFSDSRAWVSAVLADAVELRLESLERDQAITATLRLRTSANAPIGRDLAARVRVRWDDTGAGLSNRASLVVAQTAGEGTTVLLLITPPAGSPATTFALTYDGFASGERVSLWYHRADGSVVGLGEVRADTQGQIVYRLAASTLGVGRYSLVAYGQCSQVTAVGSFNIAEPQPTPAS